MFTIEKNQTEQLNVFTDSRYMGQVATITSWGGNTTNATRRRRSSDAGECNILSFTFPENTLTKCPSSLLIFYHLNPFQPIESYGNMYRKLINSI